MAFYAKKPFALTAVFIEGIIFIILTVTKVRQWIVDAIPLPLKHAIGAGIGYVCIGSSGRGAEPDRHGQKRPSAKRSKVQ